MSTSAQRYNARMNEIFEKAKKLKKSQITWRIEEEILGVANLYDEVTTSDLQGLATVASTNILDILKKEIEDCGVDEPDNSLRAVQCLKEKGLI
ncbi:MAG: hypothetical protein IMZ53_08450 [Thermoplasmata archaeon]|nr:hypothetical protein [Thermoplasmata archaeon]MBE3140599.1 hypothetical protein [Thermoplasmata archaeon]